MDKGYSNNSYSDLNAETPVSPKSYITCNAAIHSNEGEFTSESKKYISGGHGQDALNFMDRNSIAYEINILYNNGVRAGNILDSKNKQFKNGNKHTWFPSNWSIGDIREAGEYVDNKIRSTHKKIVEGNQYTATFKQVNVTIIYRNKEVSTIFPSKIQPGGIKK